MAHGKRYRAAVASYSRDESFSPTDAVALVKEHATAKFDETIELHIRTGPRPATRRATGARNGTAPQRVRQAGPDRRLRRRRGRARRHRVGPSTRSAATAMIKRGGGRIHRFRRGAGAARAHGQSRKIGADLGPAWTHAQPEGGGRWVDGADLPRAIDEARQGRVEFRLDRLALIHVPIGKASFAQEHLVENLLTTLQEIVKAKPKETKGSYIRSMYLTSTMGPSVKLELTD